VKKNHAYFENKSFEDFETAKEEIYVPNSEELCKHIALSKVGVPDNDVKMNFSDFDENNEKDKEKSEDEAEDKNGDEDKLNSVA